MSENEEPVELPESEVKAPANPGRADGPFDALRRKLGLSDEDRAAARAELANVEGEAFMEHAAFESQTDAEGRTRYSTPTDCQGTLRIQDDSGTLWPVVCDACGFEVAVQLQKINPELLVEKRLGKAGIPPVFVGKRFENDELAQEDTLGVCRVWLRTFRRGPLPAIALWGAAGRGKTHLLSLLVETLIRNYNVDAIYRSTDQLFREMRAAVDQGSGMELQWKRVLHAPVLALDDLGSMRSTPWRAELLLSLLDYRTQHELPLLVATNLPPGKWAEEFGDRQNSRMRGLMVPLRLEGPDRRAQGVQLGMNAGPEPVKA